MLAVGGRGRELAGLLEFQGQRLARQQLARSSLRAASASSRGERSSQRRDVAMRGRSEMCEAWALPSTKPWPPSGSGAAESTRSFVVSVVPSSLA